MASPYDGYLRATGPDTYEWDLRSLADYDVHPGLVRLGVAVDFVQEGGRLRATAIDSELGRSHPGDADWDRSVGLALCAATTHTSLVRHYNWVHLVPGAAFAIATRTALPTDHPVKRLLWPHIFRTQFSNWVTTMGQLSAGGDFESIFSFTREALLRLFDDTHASFDATVIDPRTGRREARHPRPQARPPGPGQLHGPPRGDVRPRRALPARLLRRRRRPGRRRQRPGAGTRRSTG